MTDIAIVSGDDVVGHRIVWQSTGLPVMAGKYPADNGGGAACGWLSKASWEANFGGLYA